jgi:SAM-dependent methyltransferase
MLAAELVGPSGWVVGIDRSVDAIARAKERASECRFDQIDFYVNSVEKFSFPELFDVVIGRYVLIHQVAPAELIRAASRHVRPSGVIAFHELCCHRQLDSLPASPLFDQMANLCRIAATAGFSSPDAAGRLVEHFLNAGLPQPKLFGEVPVGGGVDSDMFAWITETLASVTPFLFEKGLATEEELSIDTLEGRLRAEALAMHSQVELPMQVCAWARLL